MEVYRDKTEEETEEVKDQCWAVTSYCNLVTVIILLFAVTSSVTKLIILIRFQ